MIHQTGRNPEEPALHKTKNINTGLEKLDDHVRIAISVDCVIFGFDENKLKVLLIRCDLKAYENKWSLLGDLVTGNEDIEAAAYRILRERTGLNDVYMEQVKAFGEVGRHPSARVITIAYCSLINVLHYNLEPTDNELNWHTVKSLEQMAFDHKKILEVCYAWLQKRVQEHPLGFNLLPKTFSLRELQNLYEAILDAKVDRRNFRKKFFSMDLLIDTGAYETGVSHRPGKLYRFNYEKYQSKERKKWVGIDF